MREFLVVACVVVFFAGAAWSGQTAGTAMAGVDAQVQIGQPKAEANSVREELEQCRAELKKAREAAEALRKKVAGVGRDKLPAKASSCPVSLACRR